MIFSSCYNLYLRPFSEQIHIPIDHGYEMDHGNEIVKLRSLFHVHSFIVPSLMFYRYLFISLIITAYIAVRIYT